MVTGLSEAHFSKLDDSVTNIPKSVLSHEVYLDKNSVTNLKHERKSKIIHGATILSVNTYGRSSAFHLSIYLVKF